MRHVIGLSDFANNELLFPLEIDGRIKFDTDNFHSHGYFDLLAPNFEFYAQRDAGIGVQSINVMVCLKGDDLTTVMKILTDCENNLSNYPNTWVSRLGTVYSPNEQPKQIEPLLFKNKAISLIARLKSLAQQAIDKNKCLVYGNGVCYRALCGIKVSSNIVTYS